MTTVNSSKYDYDPRVWAEVEHMVRKSMPPNSRLDRADLPEDVAGVDATYVVDNRVPIALRVRYDRPAYASDIDITFRSTEPAKMAAGTYAPLMLYVWLVGGFAKAGKLVDVYRLYHNADPPLEGRDLCPNGDRTFWFPVAIEELHHTRSLLRQGDRDDWAAAVLGGNERLKHIIKNWRR
jgi:hypothetical protein